MKYFVISDVHGYYHAMMSALRKAGYKKNDSNNVLIVCGDIFDRGPDCVKVYKFLRSIPKARRILIRGNHEYLLRDAVDRGYFERYDHHNKTDYTVRQFIDYYYPGVYENMKYPLESFKNLGILKWILSSDWVNYYELDNYIFVHSWIPVNTNTFWPMYEIGNYDDFELIDDWRNCKQWEWEEATWGCPWLMRKHNLIPENKTIVCGHWHTSDFRRGLDGAPADCEDNTLYIGDKLIGLDACTAITGFCNVFTFDKE